jgi:hypothetical protein
VKPVNDDIILGKCAGIEMEDCVGKQENNTTGQRAITRKTTQASIERG